jgi:lysophospholipase L1-like esterase
VVSTLPDAEGHSLASIQGMNEFLKGKCQDNGSTFLDLRPQLCDATGHLRREFTRDGVHLNTQAYREWARAMLPLLAGP